MKIDTNLVDKIASLARLRFEQQEKELFTKQFAEIVSFVEQLSEVDTSGIEADDIHGRPDNVLSGDLTEVCLERSQALDNAPDRDEEFFLVPKVISEE